MSRKNGFLCTAAVLLLPLTACGSADLFRSHQMPESPGVADAPWPQLVDTPAAPPKGSYTDSVPDPAQGVATTVALAEEARTSAARAEALSAPVLSDADLRRLGKKR
jgi:hypothetical protein